MKDKSHNTISPINKQVVDCIGGPSLTAHQFHDSPNGTNYLFGWFSSLLIPNGSQSRNAISRNELVALVLLHINSMIQPNNGIDYLFSWFSSLLILIPSPNIPEGV